MQNGLLWLSMVVSFTQSKKSSVCHSKRRPEVVSAPTLVSSTLRKKCTLDFSLSLWATPTRQSTYPSASKSAQKGAAYASCILLLPDTSKTSVEYVEYSLDSEKSSRANVYPKSGEYAGPPFL